MVSSNLLLDVYRLPNPFNRKINKEKVVSKDIREGQTTKARPSCQKATLKISMHRRLLAHQKYQPRPKLKTTDAPTSLLGDGAVGVSWAED